MLLSFILPCYNVEEYVQQCIDSIYACNLPLEQFEVVCVNDCSPDNVQEILERNREKHDNLRIIVHQHNRGLGGARNTGIREARGKYTWFIDSDDLVTAHELKSLIQKTIDLDLDVLCFNYRRVDEDGNELSEYRVFNDTSVRDGYSFVKSVFGSGIVNHMGYVVRFLFRTAFLRSKQLFFPEKVCWEDTVFMPKVLLEAKRVAAIPDVLYSYRVNPNSISGSYAQAYPAKLIYEYAFCAGFDLLSFSDEVNDEGLKHAFRDSAVHKYINSFPIPLFRTSRSERKKFYDLVRKKDSMIKPLQHELNLLGKMMLAPNIGLLLAEMGSFVYGISHRGKK